MTLLDWYYTTWFYQHWLVFALPWVALYGAMGAFASAFFGGMGTQGRGSSGVYAAIYAHIAICLLAVVSWLYQVYKIWA